MKILIIAQGKKVTSVAITEDKPTIAKLKKFGFVQLGNGEDTAEAKTQLLENGYNGFILTHISKNIHYWGE